MRSPEESYIMIRNVNRWLIIAIIIILASGIALTLWSAQREDNQLREGLLTETRLIQSCISTGDVQALSGSEADLVSPDYTAIKEELRKIRSADPLIRFIYLMGQRPDGTVFFFVDSEPPESEDYSPPGQAYPEASAILLNAFVSGKETTEGPLGDRWGTWVSSIVPIRDTGTGKVIALLGTDIDVRDWNLKIITAIGPAIIGTALLLFLLLIFLYILQRNERERQILTASEAAIKESERQLTDIINFFPDATLVIDRAGKVISWNKAMEEMTGVAAEAMLGKGDHEYGIPFYGERRPILIDLVFDPDEELKKKYPFIQKKENKFISEIYIQRLYGGKGAYLWFIVSPLYDTKGTVTGAIESIRDITEHKQAEYALRKSEEQFRTVFEKGSLGMVISDERFRFIKTNPMFCRMVGYSQEELLTKTFIDITHPDHLAEDISQVQRLRAGEISEYTTEKQYIKKDGSVIWASVVVSVVRDLYGAFLYYLALIANISERKEIEAEMNYHASELKRYADNLMQANDKLNLLNTITRHDILNQLTVILGYLEIMKMKFSDPALEEIVDKEILAANNIQTQIMFTKDYQNIGVQSPQWFDLRKVIASAAANLPLSQVSLAVQFDKLELYADPMLEKVFYTLMENTIRHGKTVTTIEFSRKTLDDCMVVIYRDNGVGIPAEYKEAIFERKFFKHTGFGLFLSRTILGITGLSIRETGEPGKGARFEITVRAGAYRFTHSA
jgi:PAS domain S-box-containing protein